MERTSGFGGVCVESFIMDRQRGYSLRKWHSIKDLSVQVAAGFVPFVLFLSFHEIDVNNHGLFVTS